MASPQASPSAPDQGHAHERREGRTCAETGESDAVGVEPPPQRNFSTPGNCRHDRTQGRRTNRSERVVAPARRGATGQRAGAGAGRFPGMARRRISRACRRASPPSPSATPWRNSASTPTGKRLTRSLPTPWARRRGRGSARSALSVCRHGKKVRSFGSRHGLRRAAYRMCWSNLPPSVFSRARWDRGLREILCFYVPVRASAISVQHGTP
jgi:hypothetical protein